MSFLVRSYGDDCLTRVKFGSLYFCCNPKCRAFLTKRGINPDKVLDAIDKQRGFDGLHSTLTVFQAGMVKKITDKLATWTVAKFFEVYQPRAATGTFGLTTRYDVYFNAPSEITNPGLTVLHEALHSVTKLEDFDLGVKLGVISKSGNPMTWLNVSSQISPFLAQNGCNP